VFIIHRQDSRTHEVEVIYLIRTENLSDTDANMSAEFTSGYPVEADHVLTFDALHAFLDEEISKAMLYQQVAM
jgi:hypothetical protein